MHSPRPWRKNSLGASWELKQLLIQQQNLFTDHTFEVKPKLIFYRIPLFGTFCKLFCAWQRSYPLHTWQQLYIFLTPQFLIRLVNNQGKTNKKTSSNSTACSEVRSLNVNEKSKEIRCFQRTLLPKVYLNEPHIQFISC